MNDLTLNELERTAANYEELMVPAFFKQWADLVLDEAEVKSGDRLLDVACGTGVVARTASKRNGNGSVSGLDLNPGMLSVAEKIAPNIEWKEGSAEELPYEDNTFDVVTSQFSLMFFQDQEAALQEMERVLIPGGRCVVSVFDSLDNNSGYEGMANVFGEVAGADVAQALRLPFSMGDKNELRSLCTDAGLSSAEITAHEVTARFPDVRTMVLADVKGWFPFAGIELDDIQIERIVEKTEEELDQFVQADGSIAFPMRAHFIVTEKAEGH